MAKFTSYKGSLYKSQSSFNVVSSWCTFWINNHVYFLIHVYTDIWHIRHMTCFWKGMLATQVTHDHNISVCFTCSKKSLTHKTLRTSTSWWVISNTVSTAEFIEGKETLQSFQTLTLAVYKNYWHDRLWIMLIQKRKCILICILKKSHQGTNHPLWLTRKPRQCMQMRS